MSKIASVLILCCLVICVACRGIRARVSLEQSLSWLPADTETLLVANGPFWMSNFRIRRDNYEDRELTRDEPEKQFEGLTLALFGSKNNLLEKYLGGKKILLALEASRRFRPPAGLGELPFEGCALAVFDENLSDSRNAFLRDASRIAIRVEQIEGQAVAVFEQRSELDVWTMFVTFPRESVVLVATDKSFLQEMLTRMRDGKGSRALPDTLPEWKYVNKQAQFWGLRHFAKQHVEQDPTSPFGGRKSANFPDDDAIGMTYQSDPNKDRSITLTYLSASQTKAKEIEERRFSSEPKQTAGLHIQYRELGPGVIQSTYDLSHLDPADWFFLVFMAELGHALYI